MNNQNDNNRPTTAKSEDYNIENPQELNLPRYNSVTEKAKGEQLPYIENLDNGAESDTNFDENSSNPANDRSFHGEGNKTDLGNGERDDPEDEKIIRT